MHQQPTDEYLAEAVRDGHAELWEELARRVIRRARRRITNLVPPPDREDVEQDTLIAFWRALPSFSTERGFFAGFVAVITQRRIAQYWRTRGKRTDTESLEWVLDLAETAPAPGNPGTDLVAWIIEVLGPESGNMLCMHIFEGYSFAEIAREFGKSEAAAKQRVYNGRKRLRATIEANNG